MKGWWGVEEVSARGRGGGETRRHSEEAGAGGREGEGGERGWKGGGGR